MPKKTKTELRAQRDALQRFQRFLPTLELKKQQLQREVRRAEAAQRECVVREDALLQSIRPWVKLLGAWNDLGAYVQVEAVELESVNVAGVNVPGLAALRFVRPVIDYFETPVWLEDAVAALSELTAIRAERRILDHQKALLGEELRITVQRVNLFEKVMIPRTLENIRVIGIALADAQTAAVGRAKLAKSKGAELQSGTGGR